MFQYAESVYQRWPKITRDALCSYYATRNVTPKFPPLSVTLHDCGRHGPLRRERGNWGLHCGLCSDYIMSCESFLATSTVYSATCCQGLITKQFSSYDSSNQEIWIIGEHHIVYLH